MKELLKKCLIVLVFIPLGLIAQSNVNGSITEEASGMGISGINVIVKGTSNGAISDFDGNYTLSNVNDNDVIIYSYIGYKTQEITFSGQETINVIMQEDANLLGEV